MAPNTYLLVMVTIIVVITCVSVPSLFFKKCPNCGRRAGLDRTECRHCACVFPDETKDKTKPQ